MVGLRLNSIVFFFKKASLFTQKSYMSRRKIKKKVSMCFKLKLTGNQL